MMVGVDLHKGFIDFTFWINEEAVSVWESWDSFCVVVVSAVVTVDIGVGVVSLVVETVGLMVGED